MVRGSEYGELLWRMVDSHEMQQVGIQHLITPEFQVPLSTVRSRGTPSPNTYLEQTWEPA
jgi:hypothetical protein